MPAISFKPFHVYAIREEFQPFPAPCCIIISKPGLIVRGVHKNCSVCLISNQVDSVRIPTRHKLRPYRPHTKLPDDQDLHVICDVIFPMPWEAFAGYVGPLHPGDVTDLKAILNQWLDLGPE